MTNNSRIINEEVRENANYGIYCTNTYFIEVEDCQVEDNGNNGIYFYSSFNGSIIHNEVNRNDYDGISIWVSYGFNVMNNTVTENHNYGILLHHFCENNTIYGNIISDNSVGNGYDYESENSWDDGISKGNFWSDYIGPGPYYLDGPGNNLDNFPIGPDVVLELHNDVSFNVGNPTAVITWITFSSTPDYFIVYKQGAILISGSWSGEDVAALVDTADIGLYNYTVFLNSTTGYSKTDTVMVTIYDNAPTIDSPSDRSYNYDTSENHILWHPSDYNPQNYYVYLDDEIIDEGIWDGSNIDVNIDDLAIGQYNFTLLVIDTSGLSVSDSVLVTVYDIAPLLISPEDITYEYGTPDVVIFWNATDMNPSSYIIYKNYTLVSEGSWNGWAITYDIAGLAEGVYNFTLVLEDTSGLQTIDTVIVTVTPASTTPTTITTTTSPTSTTTTTENGTGGQPDNLVVMAISIGSIGVILIVVILIIRKKT